MSASVVRPTTAEPVQALVSFDVAYKQLMERWEDPHYTGKVTTDAGGKTKYGISENAYPSLDIAGLTLSRATEIAHADYWMYSKWDISKLPSNNQALANKLFQFGFNEGVGTVIQASNLSLYMIYNKRGYPKLGDPLHVCEGLLPGDRVDLLRMTAATQLARYVVKYHGLAKVPHSLLDRALCIE